jgi:hypothetical protein
MRTLSIILGEPASDKCPTPHGHRLARIMVLVIAMLGAVIVTPSHARLVRLDIAIREVVAGGAVFGTAGAYERLTGTAYFEVEPEEKRNAQIYDLDNAQRNSRGTVEFSADAVILKPLDMSKANGALYFEVVNRGNKIFPQMLHDTPPGTNNNNPMALQEYGNAFLLHRGYVIAWVGWGGDIAPGGDRLTVNFPIAMKDGAPIMERILGIDG